MTRTAAALALGTVLATAGAAAAGPDVCVWTSYERPPVICVPAGGGR